MSFGKRQRNYRNDVEGADPLLLKELSGRTPEEFSDESLFGEDKIEDLLEKKSNYQKNTMNNTTAFQESFRGGSSPQQTKGFNLNKLQMPKDDQHGGSSNQHTPASTGRKRPLPGDLLYNESSKNLGKSGPGHASGQLPQNPSMQH